MNKLSMLFAIIMILLTIIAVIPMIGMPALTYGYGTYTISLTPAMVVIILSTIYLLFTLIAIMISHSVSVHMEKSISSLAQKLADCQYEKNKLQDEKKVLENELNNLKELYDKQLKIIEKVTSGNEKETISEETAEEQSPEQEDSQQ